MLDGLQLDVLRRVHGSMLTSTYTLPATREAALQQFADFLPRAKDYARTRNFVTATHQNVTRLSPATRHRLVSEKELAELVLNHHTLEQAEKLLQEIHWRIYFKGNLEQQPGVWAQWRDVYLSSLNERDANIDKFTLRTARQIEDGECPIDVINTFSRELVERGYLHNHARMWFAAYWIHVAKLPWELGAAFFYRHLLDGDPASNTLSWRWVAGIHTPGKAYLARASNIEKYCERAMLGDAASLSALSGDDLKEQIPVDRADRSRIQLTAHPGEFSSLLDKVPTQARIGLWIHGDDLSVDVMLQNPENAAFLSSTKFVASICAHPDSLATVYGFSNARRTHLAHALGDAVARMETVTREFNAHRVEQNHGIDLAAALLAFAKEHSITHIAAMKPFVGELGDAASTIEHELAKHNVTVCWLRRAEDTALLPAAHAGFFGFWQKAEKRMGRNFSQQVLSLRKTHQQQSFTF